MMDLSAINRCYVVMEGISYLLAILIDQSGYGFTGRFMLEGHRLEAISVIVPYLSIA